MKIDHVLQFFILLFGVSAVYLVGRKEKWRRYGYISGLLGQPFWFATAIINQQWGLFILCLFYSYSWGNGIYNHWIKK